jgi:hypothetical protein
MPKANRPFDRPVINPLERMLSNDVNQINSCLDRTLLELILRTYSSRTSSSDERLSPLFGTLAGSQGPAGFLEDGFRCRAVGGMSLVLQDGLGFIYNADQPTDIGGLHGVDDASPLHPIPLSARQNITVPTADSTNPRIDIIEVTAARSLEQPATRDVIDPGTGVITATSVNKVLAFDLEGTSIGIVGPASASTTGIGYKTGTPAATPAAPAATIGYVKIAEILVGAGAASIAQNKIKDLRQLIFPGNVATFSGCVGFTTDSGNVVSIVEHAYTAPPGVLIVATPAVNDSIVNLTVLAGNAAGSATNPHRGSSGSVFAASTTPVLAGGTVGIPITNAIGKNLVRSVVDSAAQAAIAAGVPAGIGVAIDQPVLVAQIPTIAVDGSFLFFYYGCFSTLQAGS